MRDAITLACTECKQRNYQKNKNKKHTTERLELNKHCIAKPNKVSQATLEERRKRWQDKTHKYSSKA